MIINHLHASIQIPSAFVKTILLTPKISAHCTCPSVVASARERGKNVCVCVGVHNSMASESKYADEGEVSVRNFKIPLFSPRGFIARMCGEALKSKKGKTYEINADVLCLCSARAEGQLLLLLKYMHVWQAKILPLSKYCSYIPFYHYLLFLI